MSPSISSSFAETQIGLASRNLPNIHYNSGAFKDKHIYRSLQNQIFR